MNEIILSIQVVAINLKTYLELDELEKNKKLNPIDSKIISIAIKNKDELIILKGDEKQILLDFWNYIEEKKISKYIGFQIRQFDLPFITTRSFIKNVKIVPFKISQIFDLREKINAYRFGSTRGKLKEYAEFIGVEYENINSEEIPNLYSENKLEEIEDIIKQEINAIEIINKRVKELNIDKIQRF